MLKNSVRNSTPILSVMVVRLNIAKSKLLMPGVRRVASVRDSLPKPHCGGAAKQLVLNHCEMCLPPADLLHPDITLGRTLATPRLSFSKAVPAPAQVILSGKPRWKVVTPSIPQPETAMFPTPLRFEANFLP